MMTPLQIKALMRIKELLEVMPSHPGQVKTEPQAKHDDKWDKFCNAHAEIVSWVEALAKS